MTSTIKVNKIEKESGSTLTLGGPSTAVTLACGATQSGFGRTGTVDWCTTAKTAPLTIVSGNGYFINTSGGAITVTLPSSPTAGDIVALKDYANTWDDACKAVTLNNNGSKINGVCSTTVLSTESQSVTLIYVDGTKGWQDIHDSTSNVSGNPGYLVATGGTITTSGDYKIHTFNADANFQVTNTFGCGAGTKVSYVVVAGGGAGSTGVGSNGGGAGGAGGFREGKCSADPYADSPLDSGTALTVSVQTYPVTVGGGGATKASCAGRSCSGSPSIFSTITSTGGGAGGAGTGSPGPSCGAPGGSGGGTRGSTPPHTQGNGNTPPVSPPQGNPGAGTTAGPGPTDKEGYGGGGATAAAPSPSATPAPGTGGAGGTGATTSISGSPVGYAGGGGGGATVASGTGGPATQGGGTGGTNQPVGPAGTANTGVGGGGGGGSAGYTGGAGGSGVVIIRYKYQN